MGLLSIEGPLWFFIVCVAVEGELLFLFRYVLVKVIRPIAHHWYALPSCLIGFLMNSCAPPYMEELSVLAKEISGLGYAQAYAFLK